MPQERTVIPTDTAEGPRQQAVATPKPLRRLDHRLGRFFAELLSLQCRWCRARQGVVLQVSGDGGPALLAVHPPAGGEQESSDWLEQCAAVAESAFSKGSVILSSTEGDAKAYVVLVPLRLAGGEQIVTAVLLKPADKNAAEAARQLLDLMVGIAAMTEAHLNRQGQNTALEKLRGSLEVLAGINRQNRFKGVAMAFCNEMAARWRCERVSLSFLHGRYARVTAMSHTSHFNRKMRLAQDIEAAMEECLDQDCEVLYPSSQSSCINRAAGELSGNHGGTTLLTLPMRHEGRPCAAVTLERGAGGTFSPEEVEAIRLACDLCSPRLVSLHEYDRWFGARAVAWGRRTLAIVVGPQYTWIKVAAVLAFAFTLFVFFAKGWHRVRAPFVLEAVSEYKIAAPFDGFIKAIAAEVGDSIFRDQTVLAELDTAELRLQFAAAKAEHMGDLKRADAAMRDGKTAEAQIAQANADKIKAQMDLLAHRIEQARILSPVTGTLVIGDLKRQIGAPVHTGQILFQVAPLDSLRAELFVPEDEILDMIVGQEGQLATATYPGQRIRFVVERVNPAAEVVNSRNVFRVRARLLETRPWMRPGMEGVAKVTVEKRPYVWLWSRRLVNWIRMKLWI